MIVPKGFSERIPKWPLQLETPVKIEAPHGFSERIPKWPLQLLKFINFGTVEKFQ